MAAPSSRDSFGRCPRGPGDRLHDFGRGLQVDPVALTTSLRPERLDDERRTVRIVPGDSHPTSCGRDVYERVVG